MSKIFETVRKAGGEIPDLIRSLTDVQDKRGPLADRTGGLPGGRITPGEPETIPAGGLSVREIRTIRLRLPAPSPLLPFENGHGRPSEQYRILRTKIVQHPEQPRLILVSSPGSGDGKSITAINTAAALSLKSDARVLLLDADFRRSAIHIQLGLPEAPGLAEVLKSGSSIEDALVRTQEFPNLFVISAGVPPLNPVELLDSTNWQAFCGKVRSLFRYVVVDSPPVGAIADYDLIQAVCDGVVLVVRPDHTNRQLYEKALKVVPRSKFLGVVLNCVPDWSLARQGGSDYYYSGDKIYQDKPPDSAHQRDAQ
jgi:capsular exopolysaccharide synthesis family protein